MRVLYISKPPEFTPSGEAILGQCEPYTSGWLMKLYEPGQIHEELLRGTYYELRRVQRKCLGKGIDEVRRICEDARAELGQKAGAGVSRHGADEESTHVLDKKQVEKAVSEMEGTAAAGEAEEEAIWQSTEEEGVVILKPGGDAALDELVRLEELSEEALGASKDVVVDLSRVDAISTFALEGFENVAKKFAATGRHFSLAAPGDAVASAMKIMRLDPSLEVRKTLGGIKAT